MGFSLSGLASGLDTSMMIRQLMELERQPIYREESKIKTYTSHQSVFRSINTKLMTLRTAAADLMLKANYNLTSTTNSNDTVAKVTASDSASKGDYTIDVTSLAQANVMQLEGKSGQLEANLAGTITVYHENLDAPLEIAIDATTDDTYEDVMKQIADAINGKNAGMTASVIETTGGKSSLILTASETGLANRIHFDNDASEAQGSLVTIKDSSGIFSAIGENPFTEVRTAGDAAFTVNGVGVTRSTNSVTDVISGVTIELQAKGETSIKIARDAEKVADRVKAFVDAYNDVMKTIRDNSRKLGENSTTKNLQGDSTLRSLQTALGDWTMRRVEGTVDGYHLLSDLGIEADKGITTGSSMTGQLKFDRETFINKLNDNPEAVYHLFSHDGADNQDGLGRAINDMLPNWTSSVDGIINSRIKGYDSLIKNANEKIDRLEDSIFRKEEQLKRQFTAMEVALSELKAQQSWMISQLASLTSATT